MQALIVIDVQNDFMPGGALAVPYGDEIVEPINNIQKQFDLILATQDWHPIQHKSFAKNHKDVQPFQQIKINNILQTAWPNHCVQGTNGALFHPQLNSTNFAAIFRKGMNPEVDSYSAFYDNNHQQSTGLRGYLQEKGVTKLYFSGLCADICVYYSIQDALQAGFDCHLITNATRPLNEGAMPELYQELQDRGVTLGTL